jgi:two-component system sensor histidine kinase RegB
VPFLAKVKPSALSARHRTTAAPDLLSGRVAVHAVWLLRLRWVACAGQLITVGYAATVFDVRLPMAWLLTVILVTGLSNALLMFTWRPLTRRQRASQSTGDVDGSKADRLFAAVMALDVLALTALLYLTDGPTNPFVVFYFVNLALAAVILPARGAWFLVGIALLCLVGLFTRHLPLPELSEPRPLAGWPGLPAVRLQAQGLFVALAGCASVVVYFVTYVTRELRQREGDLRAADRERARSQRLEGLATLAAGAAHELATPLATIAVVAKELTRHLENVEVPDTVQDDVLLIRDELDRCRAILDRMSGSAGQAVGEESVLVAVRQLSEEILSGLRRRERVSVSIAPEVEPLRVRVPLQALAQAMRGVVRNALDATEAAAEQPSDVRISVHRELQRLRFEIRDSGPGMPPEVLARAGEPFFTTKEPGRGMGLGLFLCRSVVERLGGTMELRSSPGEGATAVIRLTVAQDD